MDDTITCPVCGQTNPADVELCHNCQWPLQSRRESGPAVPGAGEPDAFLQQDTPLDTAVPDWLRDLEPDAGEPTLQEPGGAARPVAEEMPADAAPPHEARNEDVPDWVARIAETTAADASSESERPADGGETTARRRRPPTGQPVGATPELERRGPGARRPAGEQAACRSESRSTPFKQRR